MEQARGIYFQRSRMFIALNLSIARVRLEGGLILGLAYYNNPRNPISLKELKGRLKEFVNVDFFPSTLRVKRASSGTTRGINRGCVGVGVGGEPVLEKRRNIAGANKRSALSGAT
jgi:hypothetical protein